MKKLMFTIVLMICGNLLVAQTVPYNVVFDLTSQDTVVHQMVMRWVNAISKEHPDAKLEVVFYGKSLDVVTKDKSAMAADVIRLAENKNISFTVCEGAMKRNSVDKNQLLAGVETVPDGIYQIIKRQHEGWGYIKPAK